MNPRNTITLIGYYPNQDKMGKSVMYREGDGDKKRSFYRGKLNVKRTFKDKEGNNVYDWIPFKAFGHNADFIHNYCNAEGGDIVAITGELQIGDNYEDKNGNTVYGTPEVIVDSVTIVHSAKDNEAQGSGDGGSRRSSIGSASRPAVKAASSSRPMTPLERLRASKRRA